MFRFLILLLAFPLAACSRCSQQRSDGTDAATESPSTGPSSTADTVTAPDATRGSFGPTLIAPGTANAAWTDEFRIERIGGAENLDWRSARARCQEKDLELCIETQWERACALHSSLADIESWTLSVQGLAAVVRGGNAACTTRALRAVEERNPKRAGICCSRAVAVSPGDLPESTRKDASRRLLELEKALAEPNPDVLGKLLADKVTLDAVESTRDDAVARLVASAKDQPGQRLLFDRCTQRKLEEHPSQLVFDCSVVLSGAPKLQAIARRVALEGEKSVLSYLGDPKAVKLRAKKEHVRAFLLTE
ncbi:MAG TPA: hypothetical protein VKP30_19925 [Polyangiaceae bacterium]|nr:hypothetical protein [Polyangiaceae bacterium]